MPAGDREYPALLPRGFHYFTLAELRAKFVTPFTLSATRDEIMRGLETFARHMVNAWIVGEIWIDGSFLTEKIDPSDADVLVRFGAGIFNVGYPEQRAAIQWVIANQKERLRCDSYPLFEYHESDAPDLREGSEWDRSLYIGRWGHTSDGEPKGIAVISLPNGAI